MSSVRVASRAEAGLEEEEALDWGSRSDRKKVLAAIRKQSTAFMKADPALRRDRKVVLKAVRGDWRMWKWVDPSLQNDDEIVRETFKSGSPLRLREASPELWTNKEFVLAVTQVNGSALEFAAPDLKNDREVVRGAIKHYGPAIKHASPELQADKELVLLAVRCSYGRPCVQHILDLPSLQGINQKVFMSTIAVPGEDAPALTVALTERFGTCYAQVYLLSGSTFEVAVDLAWSREIRSPDLDDLANSILRGLHQHTEVKAERIFLTLQLSGDEVVSVSPFDGSRALTDYLPRARTGQSCCSLVIGYLLLVLDRLVPFILQILYWRCQAYRLPNWLEDRLPDIDRVIGPLRSLQLWLLRRRL